MPVVVNLDLYKVQSWIKDSGVRAFPCIQFHHPILTVSNCLTGLKIKFTESVVLFVAYIVDFDLCALFISPRWISRVVSAENRDNYASIYVKGRTKMCRIQSVFHGYSCDNFNVYDTK